MRPGRLPPQIDVWESCRPGIPGAVGFDERKAAVSVTHFRRPFTHYRRRIFHQINRTLTCVARRVKILAKPLRSGIGHADRYFSTQQYCSRSRRRRPLPVVYKFPIMCDAESKACLLHQAISVLSFGASAMSQEIFSF